MKNKLKTPLLQSAAVIAAVIVLVLVIGSSGSSGAGGGIVALFSAIGNALLFVIGMGISLALSIAILIGIFLAAVAMVDSAEASKMYAGLKKKFSASLLALSCNSCGDSKATTGVSEEEYEAMKEELTQLQGTNTKLEATLNSALADSTEMQRNITTLDTDNTILKTKVDELSGTVQALQESEININTVVAQLTTKLEDTSDQELKDQFNALEQLQTATKTEIEVIGTRLTEVEANLKKAATPAKRTPAKRNTTAKRSTAAKTTKPRAKKK